MSLFMILPASWMVLSTQSTPQVGSICYMLLINSKHHRMKDAFIGFCQTSYMPLPFMGSSIITWLQSLKPINLNTQSTSLIIETLEFDNHKMFRGLYIPQNKIKSSMKE